MAMEMDFNIGAQHDLDMPDDGFYGADIPPIADFGLLGTFPNHQEPNAEAFQGMEARPPPFRKRRSAIPQNIWERFRAIIEDLYIRKQLELKDVIVTMRDEHDFDATDKMYKRQLRNWAMRKNYTQEQKKEAIQILSREETIQDPSALLDSNGRPMRVHRLLRPVQRKGNRIELLDRLTCKQLYRRHLFPVHTSTVSRLMLQQSTESQNIENLLWCAKAYFSWYSVQESVRKQYHPTSLLLDFSDGLYRASRAFPTNQARTFKLLNRCCSEFLVLLRKQPFQLMQDLAGNFTKSTLVWDSRHLIRRSFLGFLASSADAILGSTHPFANFVSLLREVKSEQFGALSTRHAELLVYVATTITEVGISHWMQLGAVDLLMTAEQFETAWIYCRRLWDSAGAAPSSSSCPPSTSLQTVVKSRMVQLANFREDYGTAEELSMQDVSRVIQNTGKPNGSYFGVHACWDLACIYQSMRRLPECKKYYRMALEGALQHENDHPGIALKILDSFEEFLKYFASPEELAQLQDQYGYLWAEMDEWTLQPTLEWQTTDDGDQTLEESAESNYQTVG